MESTSTFSEHNTEVDDLSSSEMIETESNEFVTLDRSSPFITENTEDVFETMTPLMTELVHHENRELFEEIEEHNPFSEERNLENGENQEIEENEENVEFREYFNFQFLAPQNPNNNILGGPFDLGFHHENEMVHHLENPNSTPFKKPNFKKIEENSQADNSYIQILSSKENLENGSMITTFLVNAFEDLHDTFKLDDFFRFKTQFCQNLPHKGICGKIINQGDIAYQCHTCEMDYLCFVCRDCFENGDHDGHNFEILRNPERVLCDCGDHEAWKKFGNCCSHDGFIEEQNYEIFNETEKAKFIANFVKVFYYLTEAYEQCGENFNNLNYYNFLIFQFFDLFTNIVRKEKFMCFMVAEALLTEVNSVFGNIEMSSKHNCQGYKEFKIEEAEGGEENEENRVPCSCTTLEFLFRINQKLDLRAQVHLNNFFIILFNSYEFKKKFMKSYLKNFRYVFVPKIMLKNIENDGQLTELFKLSIQLFCSEKITVECLEGTEWLNFLDSLIEVAQIYEKKYREKGPDFHFIHNIFTKKIIHCLRWLLFKRKSIVKVFRNEKALKKIFEFYEIIYKNKFDVMLGSNININIGNNARYVLEAEVSSISFFNEVFASLLSGVSTSRDMPFFKFMRKAQDFIVERESYFERKKMYLKGKGKELMRSVVLPIERIYISGLVGYMFLKEEKYEIAVSDFDIKKFEYLNSYLFQTEEKKLDFWRILVKRIGGSIGLSREIANGMWNQYSDILKKIYNIYSTQYQFKCDIVGMQFASIILGKDEEFFSKFRNSYFSNHIFSLPLRENDDLQCLDTLNNSISNTNRTEESIKNYSDFFKILLEIFTQGSYPIFIVDNIFKKVEILKDRLSFMEEKYEKKIEEVKEEQVKNILFSIPVMKAEEALKLFKVFTYDHHTICRVLNIEGNLIRDKTYVNKKIEFKDKFIKRNAEILEGYEFESEVWNSTFWFSNEQNSKFEETFLELVGIEKIDVLRIPTKFQNLDFFKRNTEIFKNGRFFSQLITPIFINTAQKLGKALYPILTLILFYLTKLKNYRIYSVRVNQIMWNSIRTLILDWEGEKSIKNVFQGKALKLLKEIEESYGFGDGRDTALQELGKKKEELDKKEKKARKKKSKKIRKLKQKQKNRLKMNAALLLEQFLQNEEETLEVNDDDVDKEIEDEEESELCTCCFKKIEKGEERLILAYLNINTLWNDAKFNTLTRYLEETRLKISLLQYEHYLNLRNELINDTTGLIQTE